MKTETERGYLMTNDDKIKTNKELAKEIVNAWNKKFDDETQEEFEDRLNSEFKEEWNNISSLTKLPTFPTINYKNNYFIPGRDFGNPQGLINLLENFEESSFSKEDQMIEMSKTLSYNIIMAFNRLDNILKQIENKLNTEEDVNKSTD